MNINTIKNKRITSQRLSAVLAAAVLWTPITPTSQAMAQQSREATGTKAKAVSVEVAKPVRRTVVRQLRMPATLQADEQVDLFAKTSGYVSRINLDIGDPVKRGDVLVMIDVPEMADELHAAEAILHARQAEVRAARAKADQAQRSLEIAGATVKEYAARHHLNEINLARKQELRDGNAIPQQALDEARGAHAITEAQLETTEAHFAGAQAETTAADAAVEVTEAHVLVSQTEINRLRTLMKYATIKAPFDGVVTARYVDHGAFVRSAALGAATPLLRVAKTDRIRIVLEVPGVDAPFVRVGTEVDIDVPALGQHVLAGKVSRTARALAPKTRTMRAEIDVGNADGRLNPGMYAWVVVKLETKAKAMVIPSKAVRVVAGETIVLVAADGLAKTKPITVGYDDGIWAEIQSGLQEDDLVISAAGGAVASGSSVTPVFSDS